jgi:hypothetical protein
MNHLALTLKAEEPDITTIAIRPGVVDTEMQRELREVHHDRMDKKDKEKFMSAKANGTCELIPFRSCWHSLEGSRAFHGSRPRRINRSCVRMTTKKTWLTSSHSAPS